MECIICSSSVVTVGVGSNQRSSGAADESCSLFESQLVIYFLCQHFFPVPLFPPNDSGSDGSSSMLETLFRVGGNPSEWIGLCGECCAVVRAAKECHKEMRKIQGQLEDCREQLKEKRRRRSAAAAAAAGNDEDILESIRKRLIANVSIGMEVKNELPSDDDDDDDGGIDIGDPLWSPSAEPNCILPDSPQHFDDEDEKPSILDSSLAYRQCVINPDNGIVPQEEEEEEEPTKGRKLRKHRRKNYSNLTEADDDDDGNKTKSVSRPSKKKKKLEDSNLDGEEERGVNIATNGPKKRRLRYIAPLSQRTCSICSVVFISKDRLRDHVNSKHTRATEFKCRNESCSKSYYSWEQLRTHEKLHLTLEQVRQLILANKLDDVKCEGSLPAGSSELIEAATAAAAGESKEKPDESIVNGILARTCPICKRLFAVPFRKVLHLRKVHCDDKKGRVANKSTAAAKTSKRKGERKNAKNPKPIISTSGLKEQTTKKTATPIAAAAAKRTCSICCVNLRSGEALEDHINAKHTRAIEYHCPNGGCDKTFYSKSTLRIHRKTHLTPEQVRHLLLANKLDAVRYAGALPEGVSLSTTANEGGESAAEPPNEKIVAGILDRTCPVCKKLFPTVFRKDEHIYHSHREELATGELALEGTREAAPVTPQQFRHLKLAGKLESVNYSGVLGGDEDLAEIHSTQPTKGDFDEEIVQSVLDRTCGICKLLCLSKLRRHTITKKL